MLQYTFVGHSMDFECWENVEEDSNANGSFVPQKISSNSCPAGKISECSSIHFNTSVTSSIVSVIRVWNKQMECKFCCNNIIFYNAMRVRHSVKKWTITLTEKISRQINYLVIS